MLCLLLLFPGMKRCVKIVTLGLEDSVRLSLKHRLGNRGYNLIKLCNRLHTEEELEERGGNWEGSKSICFSGGF